MQANFLTRLVTEERKAGLQRAGTAFSRWARGGGLEIPADSTGLSGLARRGLAGSTRPQSAQSIVEFLLVSVPLLAIIFGLLEFGLAYYEITNMDFAAREASRAVAICGSKCDQFYAADGTLAEYGQGTLYRDFYMLRQLQGLNMNMDNLEYVLLQHVGEESDDPRIDPATGQTTTNTTLWPTNYGRTGPDIYDNYQYHYQLYAYPKQSFATSDPRRNTVPSRSTNPKGIVLADAKKSQIPLLSSSSLPVAAYNDNNNGWRSVYCLDPGEPDTICRKTVPLANSNGTAKGGNEAVWGGRYVCVPSDRFFVQIVYRHNWITPFLPTVNLDGRTQSLQGFGSTNGLLISSKVYQKVEPQLYTQPGGCQKV